MGGTQRDGGRAVVTGATGREITGFIVFYFFTFSFMGYTHYLKLNQKAKLIQEQPALDIVDEVNDLVNDVYIDLLRHLVFDGQSLEAKWADPAQRDDYFHEYNADFFKGGKVEIPCFYKFPMKSDFLFCKTARKHYDIAIKVCFEMFETLGLGEATFDGEPESNRVAYMMKELNYDGPDAKII